MCFNTDLSRLFVVLAKVKASSSIEGGRGPGDHHLTEYLAFDVTAESD